jgi:prepilin-type N-terminal cleavage/methylation domain-containing protein
MLFYRRLLFLRAAFRFNIMKRIKNKKGFGLIEAMISLVILSIVLVGGMSLYFNGDEMMDLAMHKKVAQEIANAKLEEFRVSALTQAGYDGLASSTTNVTLGSFPAVQTITVAAHPVYKVYPNLNPYPPVGTSPVCKRVTVKVAWTEAGKIKALQQVELVTLIALP